MQIEIYADVVCPWCYLGKRRLEAALARSPFATDAVLRWRPFQLDPELPRAGQPLMTWLARRLGGPEAARAEVAKVSRVAMAEGLSLDYDRALIANTFDAHRLLWFADQPESVFAGATADTQPELVEALHRAHFIEGRDVGDPEVLVAVAEEVGLEGERVGRLLGSREATADVRGQLARAYDLGITSVPTFVFAGTYAVTGAQDMTAMTAVLADVARRERLAPTVSTLVPRQRIAPAADGDTRVA
ncbi:MAG TPA: DsbA family oxidoreductase [Micromonosporaceae bacterium]